MIDRRGFLNALAAVGLAGATQRSVVGELLPLTVSAKTSPGHRIVFKSQALDVTFHADTGLPLHYNFAAEALSGAAGHQPIAAIVCQLEPHGYKTVSSQVISVSKTAEGVLFNFATVWQRQRCAEFSILYAIEGSALTVTMENVVEHEGFELIELALPSLVSVSDSQGSTGKTAWMAQGRDGGSFVRLFEAKPYRYEDDDNFGRINTMLPVGAVGRGSIGCVLEVTAFMDGTETSIVGQGRERVAHIGTVQVYRVHGGRCYNMNDGKDAVCGTSSTPNLLVGQTPRCRLDFYRTTDPENPWLAAAMLLQARMPLRPTEYFDDRFVYMIGGKLKTEPQARTTFAQSTELIRDMARLTDYAPQVAYISGWVYDGQDTGYPSEDVVNSSLGSYEDLLALMHKGAAWNANVSVNVNYDDAYKSSPLFDTEFIAREPDGAVWKSRAWDGEDSYVVGMAKYVRGGWAKKRIKALLERYPVHHAMLIDAFSWFAIRNDWDRAKPASGYTNLAEGKWVILEEFRKRGVHVTSEQFRYAMLGKLALTVNGPEPRPCPFGGQQIPLTAMIYRKAAVFGDSGDGVFRPQQNLFWNNRPGVWYEHKTNRQTMTDFYYLVVLPYNKLHLLDVETYHAHGTVREIGLTASSGITIDTAGTLYKAILNGATIAADETTTCPLDDHRIAFYSRRGGRLNYPLPSAWKPSEATARLLTAEGRKPFRVSVEKGQILVDCPARTPVMVYRCTGAIAEPESAGSPA